MIRWSLMGVLLFACAIPLYASQQQRKPLLHTLAKNKVRKSKKFSLGTTKTSRSRSKSPEKRSKRRDSVILQAIDKNRKENDVTMSSIDTIEKSTINLVQQVSDTNNYLTHLKNEVTESNEKNQRIQYGFHELKAAVAKHKQLVVMAITMAIAITLLYILSMAQVVQKTQEVKAYGKHALKQSWQEVTQKATQITKAAGYSLLYILLLLAVLVYLAYIFYKKRKKLNKK